MTEKKSGGSVIFNMLKKDPWKRRAQELRAGLSSIDQQLRDAKSEKERSLLGQLLVIEEKRIKSAVKQNHGEWNQFSAEFATLEEQIKAARAESAAS